MFEEIVRLYGVDGKGILNRAATVQFPAIEVVEGWELAELADADPTFVDVLGAEDESTAGNSGFEAS
jgi:hypothetical protein